MVQTRDVRSTNYIDKITLGPAVPALITGFALRPAGSHPGGAIVPQILAAKKAGQSIDNVVLDRGYTQLLPEAWQYPLLQAGIHQTFDLKDGSGDRNPSGAPPN